MLYEKFNTGFVSNVHPITIGDRKQMYVIIGRKEGFVLTDHILITGVTGALHPRGIFHPKIVIYLLSSPNLQDCLPIILVTVLVPTYFYCRVQKNYFY